MTSIEQYKEAKRKAEQLRSFADRVQDTGHCDKFGANVALTGTYKGDYGSSSVYAWRNEIIVAMEQAIQGRLRVIAGYAADKAEREAEELRNAARKEAEEVLRESPGDGLTKGEKV